METETNGNGGGDASGAMKRSVEATRRQRVLALLAFARRCGLSGDWRIAGLPPPGIGDDGGPSPDAPEPEDREP